MAMSGPILLLGLLWAHGVLGQSTPVTTPVNTLIQNDPHFIGWYIGPTTVQALTDPLTWYTSGGYAVGCSASDACTYATDCLNNWITYDDGVTSTCNQCRTMTIYQTSPFGSPTASNMFCAENWEAYTVYREFPASTTSTSSSVPTMTLTKGGSHLHLATPTSTSSSTSAATTASAGTDGSANAGSKSDSSNAWIAGAVVGPVVGLAIIAGIIAWLVIRHRREQNAQLPVEKDDDHPQGPARPPQELEAVNPTYVHELSSEVS